MAQFKSIFKSKWIASIYIKWIPLNTMAKFSYMTCCKNTWTTQEDYTKMEGNMKYTFDQ